MIAYTGSLMLAAGQTLTPETSTVNPGYRSDEVVVGWRDAGADVAYARADVMGGGGARGAEAEVSPAGDDVVKRRLPKGYRTRSLDQRLISERTRAEARMIALARAAGVRTPVIRDVTEDAIKMERIEGTLLKHLLTEGHVYDAGVCVGRLHGAGIIHGDLTTSNIIIADGVPVFIDFGLSYRSCETESQGVDIHVLFQTLESTSRNAECLKDAFVRGYITAFAGAADVIRRVDEIRQRGRYL
jgi:N6-L-threonylcarbamoyladenine synthase/protein kinase Bud32